ncbi:MAG: hypothetical protein NVS3B17_06260 [Vulcanimicrobiaceae bacterium]
MVTSSVVRVALASLVIATIARVDVDAKPLPPAISSALATIERDADAVARGRVSGPSVQGSAREIALRWASVAPVLMRDGDLLVEAKMANASITAFEADWRRSSFARANAREVRARIVDLVAAARH